MSVRYEKLDAAESVFFERQLEYVRAKSYDVKYPALRSRDMIPVDNSVDRGAESVKYIQYDAVGMAKIISSYAHDLPRVDVLAKEFRANIKSIGDSYGYSIQEIRAAAFAGIPLEARRANAARLAIEQKIDIIGALGDSDNNLLGLFNQPNAQVYTIPAGATTGTTWGNGTGVGAGNKSAGEILGDLTAVANKAVQVTNGVEVADTIIIPIPQYGVIATVNMATGINATILEFFLRSNPWIRTVDYWHRLTGAGAGATNRMICYKRDPDHLQFIIPQEFEQFPPEAEGLEFKIACHARCGGVVVYYPLSIIYADGI